MLLNIILLQRMLLVTAIGLAWNFSLKMGLRGYLVANNMLFSFFQLVYLLCCYSCVNLKLLFYVHECSIAMGCIYTEAKNYPREPAAHVAISKKLSLCTALGYVNITDYSEYMGIARTESCIL